MNSSKFHSESLFERSKKIAPGGVHSPVRAFKSVGGVPRFIQSADSVFLTDVDGNRYLDFCMSWGPMLFGHRDPEISEAIIQAIQKGWSFGTADVTSLELAELITSQIPWLEKIRFVTSGTEAVMSALRVARAATGKNKILKFDGCYHGHTDAMLVKAGSGLVDLATPDSAGVTDSVAHDTLVLPLGDRVALESCLKKFSGEIAAAIIEPLPANNGLLIQDPEFLKDLGRLCHQHGVLLIFDEVISGFRVGFGGMAELLGIRPDLVTYGKILGGGFPVGAYGGRGDLMSLVAPEGNVYQAGTLSANPVAMSAGLAMLKKIQRTKPYAALEQMGQFLKDELEKLSNPKTPFQVIQFGSLFWILFSDEPAPKRIDRIPNIQKPYYAKLFHSLLQRGVYLPPSGYEVGFLSTAHSRQDIVHFTSAFAEAITELQS